MTPASSSPSSPTVADSTLAPSSTTSTFVTTSTTPLAEAHECIDEFGGPLDVAGEPNWRGFGDYRAWTDTDGCLIRIDVLAERTGPEHCDWEETRVLITGSPLGSRYVNSTSDIEYVRDPDGQYGVPEFVEGFQILESLPSDAIDTGFRHGDRQLWLSPSDPNAVYIQDGQTVERWPEGTVPGCM